MRVLANFSAVLSNCDRAPRFTDSFTDTGTACSRNALENPHLEVEPMAGIGRLSSLHARNLPDFIGKSTKLILLRYTFLNFLVSVLVSTPARTNPKAFPGINRSRLRPPGWHLGGEPLLKFFEKSRSEKLACSFHISTKPPGTAGGRSQD